MKVRKDNVPEKARQIPPDTRKYNSKSELVFPVWGDRSLVEGPRNDDPKNGRIRPKR